MPRRADDEGEQVIDVKRAAVYARVSTDEQAERRTIESQLHACREHAERQGWQIVEEFCDQGVSGSVPLEERAAGERLLAAAEEKAFDLTLVYRLDRLSRDTLGCLLALKRLEALRTPVVSVDERFDDSPSGQFARTVMTAVAELEKNLIRQRTMAGRARQVRDNGKYLASTTPFGYRRDPKAGQLLEHPENAEVVRQMFKWAREGLGLKAIAARLDQEGVQPPNPPKRKSKWGWHFTTVHKILTARRYVGQATYSGEPMTCPALVDEETFDAVQEALSRRRRDSPRKTKRLYLLQHLLYCRHCGGRYAAKTTKQRAGFVAIYHCRKRAVYGPKAGHEGIRWRWPAEELEAPVKRHVLKVFTDRDYLLREAEVWVERTRREASERERQETNLRARIEALREEELRVLELARKGVYRDEAQLLRQLEEVRSERREREGELDALQRSPVGDAVRKAEFHLSWIERALEVTELAQQVRELVPHADWGDDSWTDGVLAFLAEQPPHIRGPIDEAFRAYVTGLVDCIWVEDDGSLVIEGVIEAASGTTRKNEVSDSPRSR